MARQHKITQLENNPWMREYRGIRFTLDNTTNDWIVYLPDRTQRVKSIGVCLSIIDMWAKYEKEKQLNDLRPVVLVPAPVTTWFGSLLTSYKVSTHWATELSQVAGPPSKKLPRF